MQLLLSDQLQRRCCGWASVPVLLVLLTWKQGGLMPD
jgi:hypothetical protein